MADVATMKLELDASGALRSVEELGRKLLGLQPKANSSGDALVAFGSDAGTAANQTQKLGDALGKTGERARDAAGKFVSAGKEAKEAEKSFQSLEKTGNELGKKIAALGLGLAAAQFVKLADASTMLEGRLKVLGLEGAALANTQEQLRKVANQTRTSFADVVELYSRFARSSRTLGASQKDLLTVTTAISQSAIISGATSTEASNAMRQLSQGFASGTLRGEELNSVMEQLPRLADAISASLGITQGELRKMAAEGQITSKEVFDALLKQAPQLAEEFAKVPVTMSSAMTLLKNAAQEAATQFEQTTGLTAKLAEGMAWAAKNTELLVAVLGTAGLAGTLVLFGNAYVAFSAKVAAGTLAIAPLALGIAAGASTAAAVYQALKLININTESKEIDEVTKALNAQVKVRNELIASGLKAAEVNKKMQEQFGGGLVAGLATGKTKPEAPPKELLIDPKTETKRIDDFLNKLRSQIAELAKLRKEFSLRSTAAMDMSGAGTADLTQQIRERDEYTEAVKKGADLELRMLIALTQAREEYRKAFDGTGESALPLMAGSEAKTTVVVDPPLDAVSKWQKFLASISSAAALVTENMGSAFMETFSNIAARGKVTFGDFFATVSGLLKSIGPKAAAFASGPLAIAAVGASIIGDIVSQNDAKRKAAIDALNADMDAFNDAIKSFVDSFSVQGSQFEEEIKRINKFVAERREQLTELDNLLTITAFRALEGVKGSPAGAGMSEVEQVNAAIAARSKSVRALGKDPENDVAIKQLMEYRRQLELLNETTEKAIAAAKKANEQRNKTMQEDLEVRRLQAMGNDAEAKAARDRLAREREIAEAVANGATAATLELLNLVHALEAAAIAAEELKEAERVKRELGFTLGGLDAAIAREKGNTEQAEAIERDIERQRILAEVTDATVKAKYEELFALQDANRALEELKKAAELVAEQQMRSEDLEVRKLMATGKTIEAEELRFQLEQARELRRAEGELARGEITQQIFDQLREVLGLEEIAFSNRNQGATDPAGAGAASASRGGTGQISNLATAQVQDIDRVVGELTTIRVRAGQLVQLMTALVRGGGILGAVNAGIQGQTQNQSLLNGNLVVS